VIHCRRVCFLAWCPFTRMHRGPSWAVSPPPSAASYYENYIKIGILVLLIHDASDIGVDTLKLVNYTKLRGRKGWFGSEVRSTARVPRPAWWKGSFRRLPPRSMFTTSALLAPVVQLAFTGNLIAWFYFRIYVYPTSVIYSSAVQSIQVLAKVPLWLRTLTRLQTRASLWSNSSSPPPPFLGCDPDLERRFRGTWLASQRPGCSLQRSTSFHLTGQGLSPYPCTGEPT
jgi:hypothetical protein